MIRFHSGTINGTSSFVDVYTLNNSHGPFFEDVLKYLDEINEGWQVEKLVSENGVDFIPLKKILEHEKLGNGIFEFDGQQFKLAKFKTYLTHPLKMKKIFVSYSKLDLGFVNKFIEHLSALQLDGKVSHWYCTELLAGTEWDKEIQKHFDESDIVCFMVSPNFMKTKYIHEYEIAKAMRRKQTDNTFKIVPIILDFCRWTTEKNNLGQYTALPYTAKPVSDFDNQNMAWYIIEACLRLIIEEDVQEVGDKFYLDKRLPTDVLNIYQRIVAGEVNR